MVDEVYGVYRKIVSDLPLHHGDATLLDSPQVDALVVLPISAHALFSRPLVISPTSKIAVGIESTEALLSADALRKFPLKAGDRVTVTKNSTIIQLAHLKNTLFSDRLVAKFKLPVEGWRGE